MSRKSRRMFPPIVPKAREWPVVRLSRHRAEFIEEVIEESYARHIKKHSTKASLREEIETTMYRERMRIKGVPWKVDPPDQKEFWNNIKKQLVDSAAEKSQQKEQEIMRSIISRFTNEIAGNFNRTRYRLARSLVTNGFRRLLNASKLKTITGAITGKHTLLDKIQITGELEQLRALASKGTIVMVPTHFSNIDSVLVAWVIYELGLPPFIYGAGLNLFNIGIFAYFMNSVGAYKVDRRKKNAVYLETLKTYSTLSIQKGCHSLFFPGGTRSRSGKIENALKMGLLGTAIEAQRKTYQDLENGIIEEAQKVYIVPVTLNYNFVLEAPILIRGYLESKGQERFYYDLDEYSNSYKIFTFLLKFFTKDAQISVSVGRALNLVGNPVDEHGDCYDKHGNIIDSKEYFMSEGKVTENPQREQEYTRMLSKVIVKEFHIINRVMASHLVAFVGFRLFRKQFPKLDLYNFFRLEEDLVIPYEEYLANFQIVKSEVLLLHSKGKVGISDEIKLPDSEVIDIGITNVGLYQVVRPITMNKEGNIISSDLTSLFYYHNRMDGYDLEKLI